MKRKQNQLYVRRIADIFPKALRDRLDRSGTLRRFVKLASWTLLAFALDKAAQLVIVFVLARILRAEDYGRLILAQGLVNTAQILVVLGAGAMLARYIPAMREESMRRAVEIINLCALVVLGTAAIFTMVGLVGAPLIATSVLALPDFSSVPYWMVIWVLLTVISNLLLTVTLSFERGRAIGLVALLAAGMSISISPFLALRLGLEGAIAALVTVEAAKAILLIFLYLRFLKAEDVAILTPVRREDTPLLWRFGLPVFLTTALWAPTMWLAQFILKLQAPDGLAAVGIFGFTNSILGAVILMSGLTNRAALPILSSLHAKGEAAQAKRSSWLMTLGQTSAAIVIGLPLAVAAPFIMRQAGPEFASSWPVLIMMIIAGLIISGQTALGNYLLVTNRPYFLLSTMIIWSLTFLIITYFFSRHGAYAPAAGLVIAGFVRTALILVKWRCSV